MEDIEIEKEASAEDEESDSSSLNITIPLSRKYTGELTSLTSYNAKTEFNPKKEMEVDEEGLVHNAFILCAAEYAAICLCNTKNFFVQNIELEYLAPIIINNTISFEASIQHRDEKKLTITVEGHTSNIKIFDGIFSIVVLEEHILDIRLNEDS